ncbi:5-hydroxytryptamine receptor 3A [Alligator mississippiensis]|uniref:5-hydroxytryptamine receptor 3A n=1 Tax=Alligator mississippiensis TaxID=8496 RepID=A0A151P163_ALLMI|nr:5-hydroxytryptamine receptor 3A [Alligator mississippiensis]KYO42650.1 5-hydroxytryptamine receptor 3A [Alligator mississippiensis]
MVLPAWWALLTLALAAFELQSEAARRGKNRTLDTAKPALLQLSEHLLTHYNKGVRPVRDWRTTTNVAIDVMVYAILNVDEKNQVLTTYIWYRQHWIDEFLKWDPEDFDNITQVSLPTESIWVPDILINEFVDVGKSPDIPYVYVLHQGEVQNLKPIQVVTACSLDIYNFPFDVQNCSLTFTSWLHNIQDINLSLWRHPDQVKFDRSVFLNQGEWELLCVLSHFREFSVQGSDSYPEMKFYVVIRRRPLFYAVSLLLPSIFLMVMDIVGFYLPPDCGERVSFKITLLLGYSVFLIIVSDTLPATAIGTPLIGIYFIVCMALLVLSLTETILIVRLVHKQDLQPHVPDWVKWLVLDRATVLLCCRDRKQFSPMWAQSAESTRHLESNDSSTKLNHYSGETPQEYEGAGGTRPMLTTLARGESPAMMHSILQEIISIRHFLEKRDASRAIACEWLQVGYVLDALLFRAYLVAVLAYSVTLGTLWSIWQYA